MNLSGIDFAKVTDFARKGLDKARQYAEGLNELEIKVEEATNADKWGPHGTLMQEITKRSFNMEEYKQILGILARRLHSEAKAWRQIYKSLLLLEYMAKNGPQRIVPELKSNGRVFGRLQKFEFVDDDGKDQGLNVRNRAKELWNLIHDEERIASEREKASANRRKYGGHDPSSSIFQSMPTSSAGGGFTTEPRTSATNGANGSASSSADPVAATEQRVADLGLADEDIMSGAPAGGRAPPAKPPAKHKPKLSQISADTSIAGSIAAMASKFPTPPPKPTSTASADATEDTGLNLLDFGDEPAASSSAAPASADPLQLLDQLSDPVTAPPAASAGVAAATGGDDWADFTGAAGSGAGQGGDWAPFTSAGATAAPAVAVPSGNGDWAAFTGAPGTAGGGTGFADPFASQASDPFATNRGPPGGPKASGGRKALPLDAFAAPTVEPIPVGPTSSAAVGSGTPMDAAKGTGVQQPPPEKDPFADLLG